MTHFERLQRYYEMLDRAWEDELALFFQELYEDLTSNRITTQIALERINAICRSSSI